MARLPRELVEGGFRVDVVAGSLHLVHDCGNRVRIWGRVTDRQLQWYGLSHRCGPDGSEWHIGTTPSAREWHPGSSPAHLALARGDRRGRGGGA